MNTLTLREFCERIYCAYLPATALMLGDDGDLAFDAVVTDHGERTDYQIKFRGVTGFKNSREKSYESEDLIELSIIELERAPNGWRVFFAPFAAYEIRFACVEIFLNGMRVEGEGTWTQDWLPPSNA